MYGFTAGDLEQLSTCCGLMQALSPKTDVCNAGYGDITPKSTAEEVQFLLTPLSLTCSRACEASIHVCSSRQWHAEDLSAVRHAYNQAWLCVLCQRSSSHFSHRSFLFEVITVYHASPEPTSAPTTLL